MFCPNWCPSWCRKNTSPTYEVSVAVQPRAVTRVSSVQPSTQPTPPATPATPPSQPSASTSATSSLAHVRFHSTDHVSMATALRSSPSTIYTVPEDGKKNSKADP